MRIVHLSNGHVSVVQVDNTMVVLGRHRSLENARRAAQKYADANPLSVCGAFTLVNDERYDYKVGDFLKPDGISWPYPRLADTCSECCDNCMPDSLEYRCPMTRGRPLCDTVAAFRIEGKHKP